MQMQVDGSLRTKIADFGFSRAVESQSKFESFRGTIHYMAPEMIRGLSYDHRVDVFGFGILLCEVVTRQFPFTNASNQIALLWMLGNSGW